LGITSIEDSKIDRGGHVEYECFLRGNPAKKAIEEVPGSVPTRTKDRFVEFLREFGKLWINFIDNFG